MPDEIKPTEDTLVEKGNNATQEESIKSDVATGDSSTDKQLQGDNSDNQPDNAKAPEDEQKKESPKDNNSLEFDEPKTRQRKSAKDWIIQRKEEKIKKLQSQQDENEEENIDSADEELISKVIQRKLSPVIEPLLDKAINAEDDSEINSFIKDNPDFEQYKDKVRKYIIHPSRRHLPVEAIFFEVAGKDLLKLGADRQRKADEEANNNSTGGDTSRNMGSRGVWEMTPEEFEAEKEKIRRQQQR